MRTLVSSVLCTFTLALACCSSPSSSGVDHSCGSSCATSAAGGSINGDPSYLYSENECGCGTPAAGAAEGAACTKGSDCAGTCCTCGTCSGRTYSASVCAGGKCASAAQACQIALAHQSVDEDLCAK